MTSLNKDGVKLLPCKRCNSDDNNTMCPGGSWHVECNDCGHITSGLHDTQASAVAAWNRRALSASPVQAGEVVAYMLPHTHEVLGVTGWEFYSRPAKKASYEPGEFEAHVASIADAIPLVRASALEATQARIAELTEANEALTRENEGLVEAVSHANRMQRLTQDQRVAAEQQVEELEAALEPFADFGDFMEVETEGFSDTDRLELVPEESDVRIGELFVGAFRAARKALQHNGEGDTNG